ncbi:hypothetical protein [Microcystis phage Mwe-JY25]
MTDRTKYSEEELALLTVEEREALLDVEPGEDEEEDDEDEGKDEPEPAKADEAEPEGDKAKEPEPAKADAEAKADDEPKPATQAERQPEAQQPSAFPRFDAPADAEAKLAEIDTRLQALATRFDEGEITAAELIREQRAIQGEERQIRDALLMAQMSQRAEAALFEQSVDAFLAANPVYKPGSAAFVALDAEVRRLQTESGRTFDPAHLAAAHGNLTAAFGVAPKAQAPQPQRQTTPRPELPPTLGGVPASDMTAAGEGEFAHLDRLNGPDYEAALARLTPEQQSRYLASA